MALPGPYSYPKTLKINDEIWDVKFKRRLTQKDDVGLCCPSDMSLYIKLGNDRNELLKIFIHEILHAIENSYDFEIVNRHDEGDLVYKLEAAIYQVLIDNFL